MSYRRHMGYGNQNFNELTDAETERLALLAEECAEVIHAIGKILRHGWDSMHPIHGGPDNRNRLADELGDLQFAASFVIARGDVKERRVMIAANRKVEMVGKYLHHNTVEEDYVEQHLQ
jgi:NTP pyrophosphatase (non-canonical NTP hydrolase)